MTIPALFLAVSAEELSQSSGTLEELGAAVAGGATAVILYEGAGGGAGELYSAALQVRSSRAGRGGRVVVACGSAACEGMQQAAEQAGTWLAATVQQRQEGQRCTWGLPGVLVFQPFLGGTLVALSCPAGQCGGSGSDAHTPPHPPGAPAHPARPRPRPSLPRHTGSGAAARPGSAPHCRPDGHCPSGRGRWRPAEPPGPAHGGGKAQHG